MKTTTSTAALLAAIPLSQAHASWSGSPSGGHHYNPPHWGTHSGPWGGHSYTASPTASSAAPTSTAGNGGGAQSCTALTVDEIEAMGNNSLFTRWRPQSHFIAPAGWMNDPCGPMYDPTRDIYHQFYQWHPQHINWGNISWGYATSKDLITWTDHVGWQDNEALALGPTGNGSFPEAYAGLGIFSGSAQPVNLKGEVDGTLLLMYTSVSYLPTSWSIPYHPHTESQSLALSTDGGATWEQYEGNPVISATTETAPMYWNLTGFRDPFLEPHPGLDEILGVSEPHYYAVFGSGIKGVGPRIPLWTAPASDLTNWTFLGALWEPADNASLASTLTTGTYGYNFEVSGFFSLPDSKGDLHYFVNMGSEVPAGNVTFHPSNHWALWNEGKVTRRANGSAAFEPIAGGLGDWGLSYALTSFVDTKNGNRRVQWAWAPEDITGDGGVFSAIQQGFQGSHTIPRELFVHEVEGVVDTSGAIAAAKEAVLTSSGSGTYTAQTLGVRPFPDVVAGLESGATHKTYASGSQSKSTMLECEASSHLELRATITSTTGAAGVIVAASPNGVEYTTIMYEPSNNTILAVRDHSSTLDGFNNMTVTGYFSPYTLSGGKQEAINMTVFVDGSIVEVYVNDRFALTTRIYPSMECSTGFGTYVADGATADFEGVEAWIGTLNVWPERPLNSSSPLLWDTAAETNNYTWWTGN